MNREAQGLQARNRDFGSGVVAARGFWRSWREWRLSPVWFRLPPESPDSSAVDSIRGTRAARGAMLRSLALPGWGQFYNRRPIKGSIIAAAQVSSTAAFFVRRSQLNQRRSADAPLERNIFLYTTIGLILFSMGDAYVDAHLDQVDWGAPHGSGEEGLEFRMRFRIRF